MNLVFIVTYSFMMAYVTCHHAVPQRNGGKLRLWVLIKDPGLCGLLRVMVCIVEHNCAILPIKRRRHTRFLHVTQTDWALVGKTLFI